MRPIIILFIALFLASCGYFEGTDSHHYYERETMTSKCREVWESVHKITTREIDCHKIPMGAYISDVQEWDDD